MVLKRKTVKKQTELDEKYKRSKSGKKYGAISNKQLIALSDNTTDVLLLGGGAGG